MKKSKQVYKEYPCFSGQTNEFDLFTVTSIISDDEIEIYPHPFHCDTTPETLRQYMKKDDDLKIGMCDQFIEKFNSMPLFWFINKNGDVKLFLVGYSTKGRSVLPVAKSMVIFHQSGIYEIKNVVVK